MNYNHRVAKARDTAGKDTEGISESVKEYIDKQTAERKAFKSAKIQYAYARFLEKNVMTRKEFMRISNYSDDATRAALTELTNMGLLSYTVIIQDCNTKLYSIVDPKHIPEGWPAKGELLNMESPYKNYRYIPRQTITASDKQEASDNPLTRMLAGKNIHVEDASGYEQLIKDTSRFYGNEELDGLVAAIHEVCKNRIEQRYVECPLCKGRIQRTRSEIQCTNCGLKLDGGTFENSMKMAFIIAKNGVKVK